VLFRSIAVIRGRPWLGTAVAMLAGGAGLWWAALALGWLYAKVH